jgi:hypothetical protein
MKRRLAMLVVAGLIVGGGGCAGPAPDPISGLVVLDARLDPHRTETAGVALRAPVLAAADDPHGYPALVARAGARLGAAPTRVTVRDLSLILDDQDWPLGLDDVFGGDVEIRFQPAGATESYLVARVSGERLQRAGGAVVVDDAAFDSDLLPDDARDAILAGDFEAVIAGPAATSYQERRAPLQAYLMVVFDLYE